jgi:hypothetical protein
MKTTKRHQNGILTPRVDLGTFKVHVLLPNRDEKRANVPERLTQRVVLRYELVKR